MNINEDNIGLISGADLTIKIESESPPAEDPKNFFKTAILCTKGTGSAVVNLLKTKGEVDDTIVDSTELWAFSEFVGGVYIYTIPTDETQENLDSLLDLIYYNQENLIINTSVDLDFSSFKGHLCYQCTGDTAPFEPKAILPNTSVVLDTDKNGKALFILTNILEKGYSIPNISKIDVPNSFTGVNKEADSIYLDEKFISHIFRATNLNFIRGWWIGGNQGVAWIQEQIMKWESKNSLFKYIGENYNQDTLNKIESSLQNTYKKLNALGLIEGIPLINVLNFDSQTTTDKKNGIVRGLNVVYFFQNQIRTIFLSLEGLNG